MPGVPNDALWPLIPNRWLMLAMPPGSASCASSSGTCSARSAGACCPCCACQRSAAHRRQAAAAACRAGVGLGPGHGRWGNRHLAEALHWPTSSPLPTAVSAHAAASTPAAAAPPLPPCGPRLHRPMDLSQTQRPEGCGTGAAPHLHPWLRHRLRCQEPASVARGGGGLRVKQCASVGG